VKNLRQNLDIISPNFEQYSSIHFISLVAIMPPYANWLFFSFEFYLSREKRLNFVQAERKE
jgi:hypothetical protein